MAGDIQPGTGCLVHRCADFSVGVLVALQSVGGGGDTAGHHQLDVVRSPARLFPHRHPQVVGAVHDAAEAGPRGAAAVLAPASGVAMSAGLTQAEPTEVQSRPVDQALIEGERQAPVRASHVSYPGESAAHHRLQAAAGMCLDVACRPGTQTAEVTGHRCHVHVAVDKSRQHVCPAQIEPGHTLRNVTARRGARDDPILDDYPRPTGDGARDDVDDVTVVQDD